MFFNAYFNQYTSNFTILHPFLKKAISITFMQVNLNNYYNDEHKDI